MNINIQIITSKTHTCFPDLVWSCNILLPDMETRRAPELRFLFLESLSLLNVKTHYFPFNKSDSL